VSRQTCASLSSMGAAKSIAGDTLARCFSICLVRSSQSARAANFSAGEVTPQETVMYEPTDRISDAVSVAASSGVHACELGRQGGSMSSLCVDECEQAAVIRVAESRTMCRRIRSCGLTTIRIPETGIAHDLQACDEPRQD
jgi:hypothetical protein